MGHLTDHGRVPVSPCSGRCAAAARGDVAVELHILWPHQPANHSPPPALPPIRGQHRPARPHASRGPGSGASEDRSENFAAGEVTEGGELGIPQQLKNISLRFHSHVNIKKTFTTSLQFCPHTHLLNPKSCAVGFSDKVKYLMLLVNRFFCLY